MTRGYMGLVLTLAYIRRTDAAIAFENRFRDHSEGRGRPDHMEGASALRALKIAEKINGELGAVPRIAKCFTAEAGSALLRPRLSAWLKTGKWLLKPTVGGSIATQFYFLAGTLKAPLMYYRFPNEKPGEVFVKECL